MIRRILAAGLLLFAIGAPGAVSAAEGWQVVDDLPTVIGADGLPHTASCSAFPGTDAAFKFWVKRGDPQKLAVLFDGGGACWDDLTCSHPGGDGAAGNVLQFYTPAIPADASPAGYGGILDTDQPANPVRDWTLVVIPYCTGDVHLGSVDQTYRRTAASLPRRFDIRHRGFDNFMVVLDWVGRELPDVQRLLVTGGSAGGYGAIGHFPWLAQRYPQAELSVLADASQGVTTEAFDAGLPGRASWNPQLPPWVAGSGPLTARTDWLLYQAAQAYPQARIAQYTTTQDSVQVGFYAYMKRFYGPGGDCRSALADWNRQMLDTLAVYDTQLPNFRHYVLGGDSHTILASSSRFYQPNATGGVFADWLGTMLDRSPSAPAWVSAACPGCLVPKPCR